MARWLEVSEGKQRLRGLPAVADKRSLVLLLGSFPSEQSLRRHEYYANPRNQFWQVVDRLLGVPRALPYEARLTALLQRRLALWDVIAECRRKGSADSSIRDPIANPIPEFLTVHETIRLVAFNGEKAESVARRLLPELFSLASVVVRRLPSTSPANAVPFETKLRHWHILRDYLEET